MITTSTIMWWSSMTTIRASGRKRSFGRKAGRKYGMHHKLSYRSKITRTWTDLNGWINRRKPAKKEILKPAWKKIWTPIWVPTERAVVKEIDVPAWKQIWKPVWREIQVPATKSFEVADWKKYYKPVWVSGKANLIQSRSSFLIELRFFCNTDRFQQKYLDGKR